MRALPFSLLVACAHEPQIVSIAPLPTTQHVEVTASALPCATSRDCALTAIKALMRRDSAEFASYVDPRTCVRFSPYSYVDASDVCLRAGKLRDAFADPQVRHWGSYDGSGEPIDLTFEEYAARFVVDIDIAKTTARPETLGENTVDNASTFYGPDATIIELYTPPSDPKLGGMDWRSLRIVMERDNQRYYVVGIIHAEWTI